MIPNPKYDLVLERVVDVSPHLVWEAWTNPDYVKKWFTPAPWKTIDCEIDLRTGGLFKTVMLSPDGQKFPNEGCYLEIVKNKKLVWTAALGEDYRPKAVAAGKFLFTAAILLEPHGAGTKYVAIAIHPDEETRMAHEKMGFHDGWGKALEQLVEAMKALKS